MEFALSMNDGCGCECDKIHSIDETKTKTRNRTMIERDFKTLVYNAKRSSKATQIIQR